MDGMYPEFAPPEGLALEGDSGEAMVNWKRKPDGNICITTIDGVPLGSETTGAETETQPEGYASDLQNLATEEAAV